MFAVVDLETTGGNPGTDKIIEIAIYIHDGEKIVDYFSSLVNPEVPIPVFIARLTRISDEMVSSAPLFSEIAEQVHQMFVGVLRRESFCISVAANSVIKAETP